MEKRRNLPGAAAALGMLLLILDSKTALSGARDGLELCLRTVIPTLFPFFILSGILVGSMMGQPFPMLSPLGRLLGMPAGSESLLIGGFLGGYPVGAKCIHDAWESGSIRKSDAERMLSFCSNAGPAFLFGMAAPMFSNPFSGWILWGIHILGAVITGVLFRKNPEEDAIGSCKNSVTLSQSMVKSVSVTAQVCGWVIAMRIVISFLQRWFVFLLSDWMQICVIGFLELANGCMELSAIAPESIRFMLCSVFLACGGLCVGLQTISVTGGLSIKWYVWGKTVQTVLSLLFAAIYLGFLPPYWLVLLLFLFAGLKVGKKSSIPRIVGV